MDEPLSATPTDRLLAIAEANIGRMNGSAADTAALAYALASVRYTLEALVVEQRTANRIALMTAKWPDAGDALFPSAERLRGQVLEDLGLTST